MKRIDVYIKNGYWLINGKKYQDATKFEQSYFMTVIKIVNREKYAKKWAQ